jgi:hypothetical protein
MKHIENSEQRTTEQNVSGARLSNNRFVLYPMFVCSSCRPPAAAWYFFAFFTKIPRKVQHFCKKRWFMVCSVLPEAQFPGRVNDHVPRVASF